jgi:hypothetical protein
MVDLSLACTGITTASVGVAPWTAAIASRQRASVKETRGSELEDM